MGAREVSIIEAREITIVGAREVSIIRAREVSIIGAREVLSHMQSNYVYMMSCLSLFDHLRSELSGIMTSS